MKKRKINVIDLDKTLVKYDTFRRLVLREIRKGKWVFMLLAILRFTRLISANNFKARIQSHLVNNYPTNFFKDYANDIFQQIDPEVMEIVNRNTDKDTINILLSASPNEYVQPLCKLLNWEGSGSFFDENNNFHHMYGKNKINWVKESFPTADYFYHFAISDCLSDNNMMELFEEKKFWNFSN